MRDSVIPRLAAGLLCSAVGLFPGLILNSYAETSQKAPAGMHVAEREETEKVIKALREAIQRNSSTVTMDLGDTSKVQPGDLVRVNYTAALEDGSVLATNEGKVANDPVKKKVSWFKMPGRFAADELLAGKEELIPGLGDAVVGMSAGEKRHVVLPADKAFGPYDSRLQSRYPTKRTIPSVIRIAADEYVKRFSSFPVVGKEVNVNPYLKARVTDVGEKETALEVLAKDGYRMEEEIGVTQVRVNGREITTTLTPRLGAEFPVNGRIGRIVAVEGESFTVDFNDPLAGKSIALDLEVVSLTKASSLQAKAVDWVDGHDSSLAQAKKDGKPVFMVLYADWCGWCKKIFSESAEDPRVKNLRDRFVWAKVNSDKENKYKQQYGQDGYPMLVLLRPDGTVAEKIEGYRDGSALSKVLKGFLESSQPVKPESKTAAATDVHG